MKLNTKPADHVLEINDMEQIHIYGDIHKYTFEYFIYSEGLEAWVAQVENIERLKVSKAYDKIVPRIEKLLERENPNNFQYGPAWDNYDKLENINY